MAGDDAILAQFQEITGIQNAPECRAILDRCDWNLDAAIQRMFSEDVDGYSLMAVDEDAAAAGEDVVHDGRMVTDVPYQLSNEAVFNVQAPGGDFELTLSTKVTVSELKRKIAQRTGLGESTFQIIGKPDFTASMNRLINDIYSRTDLQTPLTCLIVLNDDIPTPANSAVAPATTTAEPPAAVTKYVDFIVTDGDNPTHVISMSMPEDSTFAALKRKIAEKLGITISNQVWSMMNNHDETDELKTLPLSNLSVRRATVAPVAEVIVGDSSSDDDDYYADATDDVTMIFPPPSSTAPRRNPTDPLIPEAAMSDEKIATEMFSRNFASVYGAEHPDFFCGKLTTAMRVAHRENKMLAVYVHNACSICVNVFCQHVFSSALVIEYLRNGFIVWPWDITKSRNELYHTLSECDLTSSIRLEYGSINHLFDNEEMPILLLFDLFAAGKPVVDCISGESGVDSVLAKLITALDKFREVVQMRQSMQSENVERRAIREEMETAYEASLKADRQKEQKREEEEASDRAKKLREAETQMKKQQLVEDRKRTAESRLPAEPDDAPDVTTIKIRLPAGGSLERRFYSSSSVQVLVDYITVKGFDTISEYSLFQSYPRRNIVSDLDCSKSFSDQKFSRKEALLLEKQHHE